MFNYNLIVVFIVELFRKKHFQNDEDFEFFFIFTMSTCNSLYPTYIQIDLNSLLVLSVQ